MKKILISIFLCLISLTLISCEKKTEATKTSPISSTTTTKSTQETTIPTTVLTNDELTENCYKEMVKELKNNKSSIVYYSFDLMKNSTDVLGKVTIGLDLTEANCGKLLFNLRINKYRQLTPDISGIVSLKNLDNNETEDFLYVTVSKDVFAMAKTEAEALDKDEYIASNEYAELKDVKYAVNLSSILNTKITDFINIDLGAAGSVLSTSLRGLLSTVLLNSNRSVGAAVSNIIRTLSLLGVMDSNGKFDIDKTANIVKTIIYAIKVQEYEGQTKKILGLNAEINAMVDPFVQDFKERVSTIEVVDNENKTEFGYELEISDVTMIADFFKMNINVDTKVVARVVFDRTKRTGGQNITKIQLAAGSVNLVAISIYSDMVTDIEFDTDLNNYKIVDFSEIKALIDSFKQE